MDQPTQTESPRYTPWLMALSNVLIFGAAYLVMHLYARFFVVYALMFAFIISAAYFPALGVLSVVLGIGVIIDTYLQSKKITAGEAAAPQKKTAATALGVIVIIAFVIVYIGTSALEKSSDPYTGKSVLRQIGESRAEQKERDAIYARYRPLSDARCERLKNDPTLRYEQYGSVRNAGVSFQDHCYLRKAIEANNPRYCGTRFGRSAMYESGSIYEHECISYLAITNNRSEWCGQHLSGSGQKLCESNVEYETVSTHNLDLCRSADLSVRSRCHEEFGAPLPPPA